MSARDRGSSGRGRELALAVGLAALGAGLTLIVVGQPWAHGMASSGALRVAVHASGRDATPIPAGLGMLALAGTLAVLATRRIGRLLVGALLAAAGLGIAAAAAAAAADPAPALDVVAAKAAAQTVAHASAVTGTAWPYLAVLGGLLVAAGGVLTLARGRSWPGMSARYEAPRGHRAQQSADPDVASPGAANSDGANSDAANPDAGGPHAADANAAAGGHRALVRMWDALDRGDDPT